MKNIKLFISIFCVLLLFSIPIEYVYSNYKIAINKENIVEIGIDKDNQKVYVYSQNIPGFLDGYLEYYIVIKEITYGPFDKQPQLIHSNKFVYAYKVNINGDWFVFNESIAIKLSNYFFNDIVNFNNESKLNIQSFYDHKYTIYESGLVHSFNREYFINYLNIEKSIYIKKFDHKFALFENNLFLFSFDNYHIIDEYFINNEVHFYYLINKEWFYFSNNLIYGPMSSNRIYNDLRPFIVPTSSNNTFFYEYNGKFILVHNKRIFGPFEHIYSIDLINGILHCIYKVNNKTYYNDTDLELNNLESIDFIFDSEKSIVGYRYGINSKFYIHYGLNTLGPYDEIKDIVLNTASNTLMYYARIANEWFIFEGSKRIGPYDNIENRQFNPDNKLTLYKASINDTNKKNNVYLIINGQQIGPFEELSSAGFLGHLGYWYTTNNYNFLYLKKYNENNLIGPFSYPTDPIISKDGTHYAFKTKDEEKYAIYLNDEILGRFDQVSFLDFISVHNKLVFSAIIDNKNYVYSDDSVLGSYDTIPETIGFSSHIGEILQTENGVVFFEARINNQFYIILDNMQIGPIDLNRIKFDYRHFNENEYIQLSFLDINKIINSYIYYNDKLYIGHLYEDKAVFLNDDGYIVTNQ